MAADGDNKSSKRFINYRPLFEIAIGFMLGIAVCGLLSAYGILCFMAVIALAVGVELFVIRSKRMALFLIAVLIGLCLTNVNTPPEIDGGNYRFEGKVESVGEADAYGRTKLVLRDVVISGISYPKKLQLTVKIDSPLEVGDSIRGYADISVPQMTQTGLGRRFDERKYYLSQGIGLRGSVDNYVRTGRNTLPITQSLSKIRAEVESKCETIFDSDAQTVIKLVMGSQEADRDDRTQLFRKTGVAHILAISGFHMSVLVSFISGLLPKRRRWLRIGIICTVIATYCLFCVGSAGILRSAVMTSAMLIATGFERREDGLSAISLAAILILLFNPYQLYSISFQLSFAACLGIMMLGPGLNRVITGCRIPAKLGMSTTIAATLATLALQMHYFGTVSTYALAANLVAIPIYSLILLMILIIIPIGFIWTPAAEILAYMPRSLIFVSDKFLTAVSNMPGAVLSFYSPSSLACVIFLIALFSISDYVLRPFHKKLGYFAALIIVFTVSALAGIM